ncbi:MAG: beta-lactamase family protein [Cyclobacteriaceae bacterium]|nr:beta-lactamase family protein [Cyclobacteriaceae bacterium]
MKLRFVFALLSIAVESFSQTGINLEHTIDSLLAQQKITGAVWATVSEGGQISTGASGYKNADLRVMLSPTDKVHVGSVAKTVLAAAFLRLASLQVIQLDDPVRNYLPTLPITNPWDETNPVTIRHLLNHTAGLTDARLWHVFSTSATPHTPLQSAYVNDPSMLQVHTKPGSVYSYSNLGYTILGMVIEKLSQNRYEQFLDENFLKPLGLLNSTFEFVTQAGDQADDKLAAGHLDDGQPVFAIPGYLRPAGQFTTTAEDMGIFLRFMMSDGKIAGVPFIREDLLRSVGIQYNTDAFKNGVPYGDALGAYSRDRYGVIGLAKNGNILGFSSMIYLFPEYKKAFFISHNMDSETANYDLFNEALVQHLEIPVTKFLTTRQHTEAALQQWNGYYVPIIPKVEPFALVDKLFAHTKVTVGKAGATLEPLQGKKKELTYQGNQLFSMSDRTNISHSFYKNDAGDLLITDGIRTVKKISGLEIVALATSFLLGIAAIVWILISGFLRLIRSRSYFMHHPFFLAFISILLVLISFGLIANQPFIRLGDITFGNVVLAAGSALIPLLSVISLIFTIKKKNKFWKSVDFWMLILIIQFCVLLTANKLLPMIMWR